MRQNFPGRRWTSRVGKNERARQTVERTCLGCGMPRDVQELLRFVCTSSGELLLDYTGCASGRGAYSCCDLQCLAKALKVKRLTHAFRQTVLVPDLRVIQQEVHKMLCKRLGAWLGISQKAGAVVSGYALLQKAFVQARLVGMVLAEDIAVRRAEEYRSWCVQYAIPCVTLFTQEELGHMLGKPSRSAVGLTEMRFFEPLRMILASLKKLQITHGTPEAQASFS